MAVVGRSELTEELQGPHEGIRLAALLCQSSV
jgi:hypothetical protein